MLRQRSFDAAASDFVIDLAISGATTPERSLLMLSQSTNSVEWLSGRYLAVPFSRRSDDLGDCIVLVLFV